MGKRKRATNTKTRHDNQSEAKNLKLDKAASVSEKVSESTLWGPYLSERQWGTVREDISEDGNCWESFPHSESRSRSYQYGEDGLFGWSDDQAQLCMALALWNGKDDILKERLYGLTGPQGNHGEDVKELYYYLDGMGNHDYMRALYKYPIHGYPYEQILRENTQRTEQNPEFEVLDTGVFDEQKYFDVMCEYSKPSPKHILCQYTVYNRSDNIAQIHILPQIWFRNTWSSSQSDKPKIQGLGENGVLCIHNKLGRYIFEFDNHGDPSKLYTENETNLKEVAKETRRKLVESKPQTPRKTQHGFKDAFHEYVIRGNVAALNPFSRGTKFSPHYTFNVDAGSSITVKCRLVCESQAKPLDFRKTFDDLMEKSRSSCHRLYNEILPSNLTPEEFSMATQAYAGLCWNKQYFGYDVTKWMNTGSRVINHHWRHMINNDVISMPDKWEFPWYATWDLAFHLVPFADIDIDFAKEQLLLFLNHRYMHPNGQLPAYEFDFSDVNPPVHAMACLHVYRKCQDLVFLKKVFNKLMINFNWWLNNKQINNTFLFSGGFLGMDNESCLHRSQLPEGCVLYQVDGSCWMAYYALCMMQIALELCYTDEAYIDMVVMYLDYFFSISYAVNFGLDGNGLWDEKDGFYYDLLQTTDVKNNTKCQLLRVRAMIGLSTLFPVCVLDSNIFDQIPQLRSRIMEMMDLRKRSLEKLEMHWDGERSLFLRLLPARRLRSLVGYLTDEDEFMSPYGIRSLSKYHKDHPFSVTVLGEVHSVDYNPGESQSDMFGGNSNWRGPVWFPMNYLLIESLETFGRRLGSLMRVPEENVRTRGTGPPMDLVDLSVELCRRMVAIFLPSEDGHKPCHGSQQIYSRDKYFRHLVLFYEYFHGDDGRGCGANHQTGWTALVVTLLRKLKGGK